jgi:AcrR family transcriptional regulator
MRLQRHLLSDLAPSQDALSAADRRHDLTAATEVFTTEGYAATTTDQLQLRIYPRIFDSLFTGKEDCFLQTFEHIADEARGHIVTAAQIGDTWPQRLANGLWALLQLVDEEPGPARLVLVEAQVATPAVFGRYFATIRSIAPFMREGRLLADDEMPAMADSFLPGGIASSLAQHLKAGHEAPVSSLYGELLRFLLAYYRDNPEVADYLAAQTLGEAA